MLRLILVLALAAVACGQKGAAPADAAAPSAVAAPPPAPVTPPPPAAVSADAAAPAAEVPCVVEGAWTVAPTLIGKEPQPEEQCNPAPKELRFTVGAGGKAKVEIPKKWKIELTRAEAAGCAFELNAHGPVKGGVEGGFVLTLEPGEGGFAAKGSWAEEEGACVRDAAGKATRK